MSLPSWHLFAGPVLQQSSHGFASASIGAKLRLQPLTSALQKEWNSERRRQLQLMMAFQVAGISHSPGGAFKAQTETCFVLHGGKLRENEPAC